MIDVHLLSLSMPLTLPELQKQVEDSCAKSKEELAETWVFQCAKIIGDRRKSVEEMMPGSEVLCNFLK